ncbi:MAG: hypothetical protein GXP13_00110 [Gammaproteobacteria bacterium]|nr:hypothetical protein [Gammaproteobacteria bacterium]
MKRRLYYLLPETSHAARLVKDLNINGVKSRHMHAVANNKTALSDLPLTNIRQRKDLGKKIENQLWDADLMLFFLALLSLFLMAIQQVPGWTLIIPISIMALTYALGNYFIQHIPNVHLDEFCNAMKHHEIILMIDVPRNDIWDVQQFIKHHHPEAVTGGIGWTSEALKI